MTCGYFLHWQEIAGSTGMGRVGAIGLGLESPAVGMAMPVLSATTAGVLVVALLEGALSGAVPLLAQYET